MKSIIVLLVGFVAIHAEADEGASFIVSAASNASVSAQSVAGGGMSKTLSASTALGYCLGAFEVIANFGYSSATTSGVTLSTTSLGGQINYALGDHSSAFYFGGRIGETFSDSSSMLFFGGVVGKRFPIAGPVSFDPSVSVTFFDLPTGMSTPLFRVTPLQFTLLF